MKKETALGIIVILILILGGWYLIAKSPTRGSDTIKVGVILPLTGDSAKYGEPGERVMHIALDEINAAGGVNGKSLQLVIEDGKCTGAGATSAFQKLTSVDHAQVIIGGFCSGESLAIAPLATTTGVALLSPGSTSPKLTGISPYFARNYPSSSTQGTTLADIAFTDKSWKNVAFIQEQTDYAVGVYGAFTDALTKLGGTITKEEFPTDTTDFRSIVTKVRSENPDALFIDTQTAASADRVLKQIAELGWKPKLLVANIVVGDPTVMTNDQSILEGALSADFSPDASNAKFSNLLSAYSEKYSDTLPYQSYAQAEYDAVYLVRDAITAVGYDGPKLAAWLHSVQNWEGAEGSVSIGSNGDSNTAFKPVMITGGKTQPYTK